MKSTTTYAFTWLATAIAVSVAVYITKNATPLWAFIFPSLITVRD